MLGLRNDKWPAMLRARHAVHRRLQQATGYVKFNAKSIKDAYPMINAYAWAQGQEGMGRGNGSSGYVGLVGFL